MKNIFLPKNPKIIFLGQKKKLNSYIKNSICGLGNLQIATGVQGKILTYMSFGLPSICSKRSGINFGSNVLTYNSDERLISHIVNLKKEKKLSLNYSSKSLKFVNKYLWKNVKVYYLKLIKDLFKNKPSAGAGGAHKLLFFDFRTFLNFFMLHLPSPTNFKQPTIDLTCCCKKDLETKLIDIFSPDFEIFA